MKRFLIVLMALAALAQTSPALAGVKTGTRDGTVSIPCTIPKPKGQELCGVRVKVPVRIAFSLVTDISADVDVYFYTKDDVPTSSFTHPTCDGESGEVLPDAAYGVIVLAQRGCGTPRSASFTFSYRTVPGPPCPDAAPNCKPFWAKLGAYIVLAFLFGPIVGIGVVAAFRRARRRRVAA